MNKLDFSMHCSWCGRLLPSCDKKYCSEWCDGNFKTYLKKGGSVDKTEKDKWDNSEPAYSKNLMSSEHKATSDKYREGYDRIEWDKR